MSGPPLEIRLVRGYSEMKGACCCSTYLDEVSLGTVISPHKESKTLLVGQGPGEIGETIEGRVSNSTEKLEKHIMVTWPPFSLFLEYVLLFTWPISHTAIIGVFDSYLIARYVCKKGNKEEMSISH
ncbi:hypothetical protein RSAG8_11484, partial [Rhizoctonia solani AG-8 WAC10335]